MVPDEDVIEDVLREIEVTVACVGMSTTVIVVMLGVCEAAVAKLALLSLMEVEVTVLDDWDNGICVLVLVRLEASEAVVVELALPPILDGFREEIDEDVKEAVVSAAEAEVTVADCRVALGLPEVFVDEDSPLFDVVLVGELLSTPLEKNEMQARTAMP